MMPPRGTPLGRPRALRAKATDAEQRLGYFLRRRQLEGARFRGQVPLGRYIVDFACLEHALVVEVDGGQHGARIAYDDARTKWLEEHGWRVLRFWNNDVQGNIGGVLEAVREALRPGVGFPLPALPRKRGRNREEEGAP
jgi:very-short-patch-repair endonuclease